MALDTNKLRVKGNHKMKTLWLALFAAPAFAGCLTIDTITIMPPPACASGTCDTGPGVVTAAGLKAMMVPRFEFTGHNSCKTAQPVSPYLIFDVEVAFYDKEGFRTGVGHFYVGKVDAGEKVRHAFEIPDDATVLGTVTSVKVKLIIETGGVGGK